MNDKPVFDSFLEQFRQGSFTSALRWHNLDDLWQCLRESPADDWYVYAIGSPVPEAPVDHLQLLRFIDEVVECHNITGANEYMLRVETKDLPSYKKFHADVLGECAQVQSITTMVVMDSPKDRR